MFIKEKIKNSFRNKLIVFITIISVIVFIIIILLSKHFISSQINNLVEDSIQESNQRNVEFIADWFDGIKRELKNYSDTPFIREVPLRRRMNWSEIENFLLSRYHDHKHIYEYLFIVEPGGEYDAIPSGNGNVEDENFYLASMEQGKTYISDPFYSDVTDDLVVVISTPINLTSGETEERVIEDQDSVGVMAGAINLSTLISIVEDIGVKHEESFSYIVNSEGEIIAHPDNSSAIEDNITELDGISEIADDVLAQSSGQVKYTVEDEKTNLYFSEIPDTDGWKLITQIPEEFITTPMNNILMPLLVMFVLALFILLVASYLIGNYVTRPLEAITDSSRKISNKKFSQEEDIYIITEELKEITSQLEDKWMTRGDEIGVLARAYQGMKDNLLKLIENIASYGEEITQLNQELEYQAFHDPLTELPNRRKFINELEEELKLDLQGAVLLLDLDNFKEINDTLGHIYGDKLLKKVGERLLELEGEEIFVARYGGDEFLLLLKNSKQRDYIDAKLKEVKDLFSQSFYVKEDKLDIDYSLGIARYPIDACSTDKLITNADTAMYRAKELGKKHVYYDHQMIKKLEERKKIKDIIRQAIEVGGFELKYQPQINLKTGKADYLEALIRLTDYDISPGKFIPIAEESNLIVAIGRWVTNEAIEQLATWQKEGIEPKKISINFSVRQLKDDGYIEFIKNKLAINNVSPALLEIEITESILLERENEAIEFLYQLRNLGLKIALDDFGTGYSSLNYLTYIDLDRIKLDKSLNDKFLRDDDLATMDNLISLFHTLNLPIVAEGIETKEQYEKLKSKNCDYIQGYLFSKPVSIQEIEKIYDKNFIEAL